MTESADQEMQANAVSTNTRHCGKGFATRSDAKPAMYGKNSMARRLPDINLCHTSSASAFNEFVCTHPLH